MITYYASYPDQRRLGGLVSQQDEISILDAGGVLGEDQLFLGRDLWQVLRTLNGQDRTGRRQLPRERPFPICFRRLCELESALQREPSLLLQPSQGIHSHLKEKSERNL